MGVLLSVEGARLRVNAPQGQLDDELKAQIAQQKGQLLELLANAAAAPEGRYPVSFAQRRLWFLNQLEPDNAAYHLGAKHFIAAAVDAPCLEAAVNDVLQRQAALRTVFAEVDGEPVQVVRPFEPQPLMMHDLSALPGRERDETAARLVLDEAVRPFDLVRGPLFRAALLRVAPDAHVLLFTVHHIVCDGWSLGLFLSDLQTAYEARAAGHAPTMPPLPLHYSAYAAAERERLAGPTLAPAIDHWRQRLAGAAPTLDLPTDRARPSQRTFGGASVTFEFSPALSDALRAMSRRERVTPYMTLLALFNVLLSRLSGQTDIVVGTPVANRPTPAHEQLIGLFVSTLPIRSDLSEDPTFRELVAQVRENVIEAQAHGDLPFEKLVDELRPERSMAWSPIFQVVFALQNMPLASSFDVTTAAAMYDLSLFMWDEPRGIRGAFEYNTALFDAASVQRWREHFETLCKAAVATPELPVSSLPLLTPAGREQILVTWNTTARSYPSEAGLPSLFAVAAGRWPQAIALESADPAAEILPAPRLTYAELARGASGLAARLRDAGVRRGDRVGLYMERSAGTVAAILAIVEAGGAYVPLDTSDPIGRTVDVLTDAGAQVVLAQRSLAARLQPGAPRVLVFEDEWADAADRAPEPAELRQSTPVRGDDLAYVMFTSGTTGKPKGVCVSHRNIARLVCNTDYVELGPDEVMLQFAPLAFDASTLEIWGALLNGARLVVHPQRVPTAAELADTLRRHSVTTLWLTAGFFHHMVEQDVQALADVRQVLAGGDVLSVSHVQRLLDAKRSGVVINGYGPTENTTFTCCHRMKAGERLHGTVPIGKPIANTRVYLLDPGGEPVPPGVPGELFAGGDGVARGYLANPLATAEKFRPDPFDSRPGATMYRTGDLARWRADGCIEFLGRRDRQVKVRGFRIELEEIEDALRQCAPVRDAAVVTRDDASGGNSLIGYLVPRQGAIIDPAAIRLALGDRLPAYMVPSRFVDLAALPLTPNGKLDRAALPIPSEVPVQQTAVEPRTLLETQLLAIWERLLGRTGISITGNFFELGGHSLLAVRLFAQIEQKFGVRLPVSTLFAAPDVSQLAERLEQTGFGSPWSSLVAIRPEGSQPPLFLVPGVGGNVICYGDLARHLRPDQPLYGLQSRGIDEREEPLDRIESMAAAYLAEIRRMQPRGPYRLGGTCFGGVVAYEMAQQLRSAGETVEALFLLETWPPSKGRSVIDSVRTRSHHLHFLLLAVKRHVVQLWHTPWRDWKTALRGRLTIVQEIAAHRDIYRGDRAALYVDRVSIANQRALLHYRPRPYSGSVRCAIATARPVAGTDPRRIWQQLAPADFGWFELPAPDSGMMLLPPHVEPLAQWMGDELKHLAQARGGTAADEARHVS
jgi:aspartate racemase